MKVAFWNGASPSDGAGDYLAAIGTILSVEKNCNVVLSSNYISNHMLHDCFSSRTKEEIAHKPYRLYYGMQEYFRTLYDLKINRQGSIMQIPMEEITIIYPPDVMESVFYYEIPRSTLYLLDVAGESNVASQSALEEADIVVVFLPQDDIKIQRIFVQFSALIPKTIFVIDGYQRNRGYSRRNFAAKYGYSTKNIGVIPPNSEFKEICKEGRLDFYLKENMNRSTKEPQYYFMLNLKAITKLIYDRYRSELMKG